MNNYNLAPIVLFVFNRLPHTKATIEALQKNKFASRSDLIIFSDGPKVDGSKNEVLAVREYLHNVCGFKSIAIIEREHNWGLAESIISGVTEVVNVHGKIIVLEDDLITSPFFLEYMNDALEMYKDEDKVISILGYMCPIKNT